MSVINHRGLGIPGTPLSCRPSARVRCRGGSATWRHALEAGGGFPPRSECRCSQTEPEKKTQQKIFGYYTQRARGPIK